MAGNGAAALATFREAEGIGSRFGDQDLVIMARHGQGRALVRLGRRSEGVALFDEVMTALTAGDASPIIVGTVYCSVIEGCQEIFDLRRAHEWTAALTHWCAAQPDLVPYRGQCLVRRAEMMHLHGAWDDALVEAERACEELTRPRPHPARGAALYELGELHRLRGDFEKAEAAYRGASELVRSPQPGLAQLRLAQGQIEAAYAAIRRMAAEASEPRTRVSVLAACVDISLAARDVGTARAAADELSGIARQLDAPYPRAVSAHAQGAVFLAEGDPRAAVSAIADSLTTWQDLDAPYEGARARVLLGQAYRALGDNDAAATELETARRTFESLGAAPDATRIDAPGLDHTPADSGRLSGRELQVLGLLATGRTNRAIAERLGISEKTVARHVSNIFTKLGLSTRAAATAYAYEHDLV
jgi:ATP/maltotriose-dependent transcriptional regulator MalT